MALSRDVIEATVAAARDNAINPAALLAVVEIESGGRPFEADGKTPRFLFERHKFYSELDTRASDEELKQAVDQGLAHKDWRRATQYADQGKSADRIALLGRAAAIHQECAHRACSWGLGQTMGFHAERLGYPSAVAMVDAMVVGGVRVQIDCMIKEIMRNRLEVPLAKRNWAAFARGYNGPRYEENDYDGKLARAYAHWAPVYAPQGAAGTSDDVLEIGDRGALVMAIQERLAALGYSVGRADGIFGSRTRAAVAAFQLESGLSADGIMGPQTRKALNDEAAKPMPLGERAEETAADLRASGSEIATAANDLKKVAVVVGGASAATGTAQTAAAPDMIAQTKEVVTEVSSWKAIVTAIGDTVAWATSQYWILGIVLAFVIYRYGSKIEWRRLLDHRSGTNLGR